MGSDHVHVLRTVFCHENGTTNIILKFDLLELYLDAIFKVLLRDDSESSK